VPGFEQPTWLITQSALGVEGERLYDLYSEVN
jgi:hypothetical protein